MSLLRRFKVFGILALFIAFTGCAGPSYHLSEQAREHLGSTDVILGVEQQEINADIAGSDLAAVMGGGLIPALIDVAIEKGQAEKADKILEPIRDVLVDYDFPTILNESLSKSLRKLGWLHLNKTTLIRESGDEWIVENFSNSEANAVLYIIAAYQFSCKFEEIHVSCKVFMLPKAETLYNFRENPNKKDPTAKGNNIYRNDELKVTKSLNVDKVNLEKAVELWADNGGQRTKDALNEAALQLADIIAEDLCVTENK